MKNKTIENKLKEYNIDYNFDDDVYIFMLSEQEQQSTDLIKWLNRYCKKYYINININKGTTDYIYLQNDTTIVVCL